MVKTISKDIPLGEITLRKYEKPNNLNQRELIRKLCLSIGLLQPGDSRDVIVEVLQVMLNSSKSKKMLTSDQVRNEVVKLRKKLNLPLKGIAESNVRRQLKRLRALFLVEKVSNEYRINEWDELNSIYEEKIEKFFLESIKNRVREYFSEVNKR